MQVSFDASIVSLIILIIRPYIKCVVSVADANMAFVTLANRYFEGPLGSCLKSGCVATGRESTVISY